MRKRLLIAACVCAAAFGQESTHDAPVELRNNTVHAIFRPDTLIDRIAAKSKFGSGGGQVLQHTHHLDHTLRIFVPNLKPRDMALAKGAELHFRLTGKRRFFGLIPGKFQGYVTVKVVDKPGTGGMVAGHAAKNQETSPRCSETLRDALARCAVSNLPVDAAKPRTGGPVAAEAAKNQETVLRCEERARNAHAGCVESTLPADEKRSLNLVWSVDAPGGFAWGLTGGKSDAAIAAQINKIGALDSHADAKAAAKLSPIEYLLQSASGSTDYSINKFYVVSSGGQPSGHGNHFSRGSRLVVCENENVPGSTNVVAACPDR